MFSVSNHPTVQPQLQTDVIVWPGLVLAVLLAQAAVVVGSLALTFFFQSRKRNFL